MSKIMYSARQLPGVNMPLLCIGSSRTEAHNALQNWALIKYRIRILMVLLALLQSVAGRSTCLTPVMEDTAHQLLAFSTVLQDHMVIQQNKPFTVWGRAEKFAKVLIEADWMVDGQKARVAVRADADGRFRGILAVPKATAHDYRPHQLKISSHNETRTIKDLLIGDLWFLSGQSNMQFAVHEMLDSTEIINNANAHIRLLNVALNFSATPMEDIQGNWQICTPVSVRDFSAVGYSFGNHLQQRLDIPVGLIFSGIGASTVQAFVPEKALAADAVLNKTYLTPYLQDPKSRQEITAGFSFEKVTRPFLLYNALIHPFIPLSIKGFCWYQGETNYKDRAAFARATITLIKSWRAAFKQGCLPFEFVQIAPYAHEKLDSTLTGDAYFREVQASVRYLNNTYMALTLDVGNPSNLHPKNKRPVGERLAAIALNRTYNQLQVPYLGPQFQYVAFNHHKAIIHFEPETVSSGLMTHDGRPPRDFYLAGSDSVFYPAQAVIVGNTVELMAPKVATPLFVRYAFYNYPVTNLQNKAGLPAESFRTDNFLEKKADY